LQGLCRAGGLRLALTEISDLGVFVGLAVLCLSRSRKNIYTLSATLQGLTVGAAVSENKRPSPDVAP
jgi:hypothetical protein